MRPSPVRNGCGVATIVSKRIVDRRVDRGSCSGFLTISSCRHVGVFSGVFDRISVGVQPRTRHNLNIGVFTTLTTKAIIATNIIRNLQRRRRNPRFCNRHFKNRPHPCFGPNISAPESITVHGFRTRVGRSVGSVEEKEWERL